MIRILLLITFCILSAKSFGQNFNKHNQPKSTFVELGLGAGKFFTNPRPNTSVVNDKLMPSVTLGIGKKLANHFSIESNFNFQQFKTTGLYVDDAENKVFGELFSGNMFSMEVIPMVNLIPSDQHLTRANLDFSLGIGVGYLGTNTKEKFSFQNKNYEFNFLDHGVYIPIRTATTIRLDYLNDIVIEGSFLQTSLTKSGKLTELKKNSDDFGQLTIIYRRYIWR